MIGNNNNKIHEKYLEDIPECTNNTLKSRKSENDLLTVFYHIFQHALFIVHSASAAAPTQIVYPHFLQTILN